MFLNYYTTMLYAGTTLPFKLYLFSDQIQLIDSSLICLPIIALIPGKKWPFYSISREVTTYLQRTGFTVAQELQVE